MRRCSLLREVSKRGRARVSPIVDHVLRTKTGAADRSIRAIILYPMNALANSQLEPLRGFPPGGRIHDAVDDDGVFHPDQNTSKRR